MGHCCYYHLGGAVGFVYVIYADVSSDERPPGAGSRLLTSSTTKLSSLLSASLPCEGGEKARLDVCA